MASNAASGTPPPMPLPSVMMSGSMSGVLVVEQLSGAAHAGLDLVDDQQQAVRLGQRPQFAQELIGRGPDAGFALDRLQHHGRRSCR